LKYFAERRRQGYTISMRSSNTIYHTALRCLRLTRQRCLMFYFVPTITEAYSILMYHYIAKRDIRGMEAFAKKLERKFGDEVCPISLCHPRPPPRSVRSYGHGLTRIFCFYIMHSFHQRCLASW
jgi:hypothetical protein